MFTVDFDGSSLGISKRPPRYGAILLCIICAAFSLALLWAWFGEIDHVVRATGVLRPQANVCTVRNIVSGKVKTVNLREGSHVRQGETLLTIDTEMLELRLDRLKAELAELEKQLAELNDLRSWVIMAARDGSQPACGVSDCPQSIHHRFLSFKSQYDRLLLAYRQAEASLERHERSNALPEHELLRLKLEKEAARLNLDNYLHDTVAALDQERSIKAERLRTVQDQIAELEHTKQLSRITAPISGTVQLIHQVSAGEYLPSGHELARIIPAPWQALCVEISVRNQDIALIEPGQAVVYRFEALPRHQYGAVTGTITGVAGDAVLAGDGTLVYRVFGSVDQAFLQDQYGNKAELKPGMACQSLVVVKRDKILHWLLQKLGFLH